MKEYDYLVALEVRDYELDLQGIVNNAVYQNYLEHCRHGYLRAIGFSFSDMHAQGLYPVIIRSEIDYLQPLKSGEHFVVGLKSSCEGRLRYLFHQEIVREEIIVCRAKITVAILRNGVPAQLPEFQRAIEDFRTIKKPARTTRLPFS